MRQRREDEPRVGKTDVVGRTERDLAAKRQLRGLTALRVGRRVREGELRMTLDECAKLAARITGGPEHADWNLMHY
jgi:hypothetical protein